MKGDDAGMSSENITVDASNVKLFLSSRHEPSQELGVEPPTFWTKFALRRGMMSPFHALDEAMLDENETAHAGTIAINSTQVSFSSSNDRSWCIAKTSASPDAVQAALDWACGPIGGADCDPIQLGNACYQPNTVYNHGSYAFNSYYQIHQHASGTCDFGGTATVIYEDPSYLGCTYPDRSGQPGAPVNAAEASKSTTSSIKTLIAVSVLLPMWVM